MIFVSWSQQMTEVDRSEFPDVGKSLTSLLEGADLHRATGTVADYGNFHESTRAPEEFPRPKREIGSVETRASEFHKPSARAKRIRANLSGPGRGCPECAKEYHGDGRKHKLCKACATSSWVAERTEQYRELVAMLARYWR